MAQRYVNSKFGDLETATTSILVPTVMVRFNSSDIHRPVSTQDYYEVKRKDFEFVKRPVESSLSVCSML